MLSQSVHYDKNEWPGLQIYILESDKIDGRVPNEELFSPLIVGGRFGYSEAENVRQEVRGSRVGKRQLPNIALFT